jgi:DNA-binding beta-propeller fold protein YncE
MKMNKLIIITLFLGFWLHSGCTTNQQEKEEITKWKFSKTIPSNGIAPIGIVVQNNFLWLSDVDNNRIVKIDHSGKIIEQYPGFNRPMHMAIEGNKIYIPEYTSDTVRILENGKVSTFPLTIQTDAISGIAMDSNMIAFTDFYNHRIILQQGEKTSIIGEEGHNDGELYYPTDIAIHNNLIYVADAYNNRVQVFDLLGNYVKMIGWNEGIKVATGLSVTDNQVIVTDFDGNRILVYDLNGNLLQTLSGYFNKPTDIVNRGDSMYVANYGGQSIVMFITGQ